MCRLTYRPLGRITYLARPSVRLFIFLSLCRILISSLKTTTRIRSEIGMKNYELNMFQGYAYF